MRKKSPLTMPKDTKGHPEIPLSTLYLEDNLLCIIRVCLKSAIQKASLSSIGVVSVREKRQHSLNKNIQKGLRRSLNFDLGKTIP